MSRDYVNPCNLSDYKAAQKAVRKYRVRRVISESEKFSMSNKSIGGLINRSASTASRLMNWGAKNNIVKLMQRLYLSGNGEPHFEIGYKPFYQKSNLMFF